MPDRDPIHDVEKGLPQLLEVMARLRDPKTGCPWDIEQDFNTIAPYTIEEAHEVADAIEREAWDELEGELGDLLLHIAFYSRIGSETNSFDIADVANSICDKLINRHPHIYGDVAVTNEEDVKRNWENIKLREGKKSVLEGVPNSLPALVKANRIQEKVAGVGFDWERPEQVFEKVKEELSELQEEINLGNKDKLEAEFGDVLFSIVNYARFLDINPESALERTNKKFIKRFQYLESKAKEQRKNLKEMSLDEMDVYWEEAKKI